ncbi:hypothetical protein ACNKHL_00220 [Shigella flexneri]
MILHAFIDFTRPKARLTISLFVASMAKGWAIGTTGFDEAGGQAIRDAAADIVICLCCQF